MDIINKYLRTLSTVYSVRLPIMTRASASIPILRAVSLPQDNRAANPSISTARALVGANSRRFRFRISVPSVYVVFHILLSMYVSFIPSDTHIIAFFGSEIRKYFLAFLRILINIFIAFFYFYDILNIG